MNTTEDRLRAATRQTAAEITPASVPPLSLPAAGPGRERADTWPGGRRPGRARLLAPLAAAAAVLALAAGSVTAKDWAAADRAPNPSRVGAANPIPIGDVHRSQLDTEVIDDFLPATGAEYTTGARLDGIIAVLKDASTDSCMARLGFHIPRLPAAVIEKAVANMSFDNTQFPDLAKLSRTKMAPLYFKGVNGNRGGAFNVDLDRCEEAAAEPFLPLTNAGWNLGGPWWPIVTRIQSSAQVRATLPGLRSCAERYGWPHGPKAAMSSFTDFAGWVASHIDGPGTRGADRAEMTGLGRTWSRIFVTCARPTVTTQERLLSARRAVFIQQHIRQVRALEALAWKVITEMRRPRGATGNG